MMTREDIILYTAEQSLRRRESQIVNLCVLNFMIMSVFASFIYLVNQQIETQLISQPVSANTESLVAFNDLHRLAEQPIMPTLVQKAVIPLPDPIPATDSIPQVMPTNLHTIRWQKAKVIRSRWLFKKKTASLKRVVQSRQQALSLPIFNTNFVQKEESQHKKKLVWNKLKGDFELEK